MVVIPLERGDILVQVRFVVELVNLLLERLDQVLGEDFCESTNVEDVLLGIKRRQLAAELRQGVHDLRSRSAHPRIKRGEQSRRTAADDRDVGYRVSHL